MQSDCTCWALCVVEILGCGLNCDLESKDTFSLSLSMKTLTNMNNIKKKKKKKSAKKKLNFFQAETFWSGLLDRPGVLHSELIHQ